MIESRAGDAVVRSYLAHDELRNGGQLLTSLQRLRDRSYSLWTVNIRRLLIGINGVGRGGRLDRMGLALACRPVVMSNLVGGGRVDRDDCELNS